METFHFVAVLELSILSHLLKCSEKCTFGHSQLLNNWSKFHLLLNIMIKSSASQLRNGPVFSTLFEHVFNV